MSKQRSLEQERAKIAWQCIEEVKRSGSKGYGSLARSAPADIQANGLGQAMAFWRSKGYDKGKPKDNNPHAQLLSHTSSWINQQLELQNQDVLAWIVQEASTDQYRRATAEAIAFLTWLKRFAEAELAEGEG